MLSVPATSAAFHSLLQKTSRHPFKTKYPQPGLSCHRTKCWLVFSSLLTLAYHLPAQPTPISLPSSQACWNLNFKWTPSMATIDKKGAFDCSCVAEKKGGDSSWLRPSRNSSSTAPLPLQWDAWAWSYSFKLPASMFPFKEDEFFRFPLKELNVDLWMKNTTKLGKLPKGSVTLSSLDLIQYLLIPSRTYSYIIYKGGGGESQSHI